MEWHKFSEEDLPPAKDEYLIAYHNCHWDWVDTSRLNTGVDTYRGFGKAAKENPHKAWAHNKYKRVVYWAKMPEPPKEG